MAAGDSLRLHRPRLSSQTFALHRAQFNEQVESFRRSVELFQRALASRSRVRPARPTRAAAAAPPTPPTALASPAPAPARPIGPADWGPLTTREREVAALIARGWSNRQIAAALVLTEGTVANHVRRVLLRLGFESRSRVAAWVAGDGARRAFSPKVVQSCTVVRTPNGVAS